MSNKYWILRTLLKSQHPHLPRDLKRGDAVYRYHGPTYGCISSGGVPFTEEECTTANGAPITLATGAKSSFFEIPVDAFADFEPVPLDEPPIEPRLFP